MRDTYQADAPSRYDMHLALRSVDLHDLCSRFHLSRWPDDDVMFPEVNLVPIVLPEVNVVPIVLEICFRRHIGVMIRTCELQVVDIHPRSRPNPRSEKDSIYTSGAQE